MCEGGCGRVRCSRDHIIFDEGRGSRSGAGGVLRASSHQAHDGDHRRACGNWFGPPVTKWIAVPLRPSRYLLFAFFTEYRLATKPKDLAPYAQTRVTTLFPA